jgi:hypothetical protein
VLYAIPTKNKKFSTLFYAGSTYFDKEKNVILGGGMRISYHAW